VAPRLRNTRGMLERWKKRWEKLRYHPEQARMIASDARFKVVPAGRRSGKTEILGKRIFLQKAIAGIPYADPKYFVAAPTRDQVKRIYWNDLKIMTRPFWSREPSESNLIIYLKTGGEIHAVGMDKPERIEGSHWDGCVLDEYANMKPEAWVANIRPALSTPNRPPGWCNFIGVPEGRNHYYEMYREAQRDDKPEWDTFTWHSADIMDPAEVESAKRDMDELTFQQEFLGSFISFSGRVYYNFDEKLHVKPLKYRNGKDLYLCFDFNINPGVCAIIQEAKSDLDENGRYRIETRVIDEVHIPKNSNTILVSKRIGEKYKGHTGNVILYGDASGGAGGSAKVMGSDWELVRKVLWPYFTSNLKSDVPLKNPRERERVNSVNSRLLSASGEASMYVDPKCVNIIKDFEGVTTIEGGSGEIDKKTNKDITHLSDAIGYYAQRRWPIRKIRSGEIDVLGI